jgi:protein involved in polysaccharide export with SLBB domain
VPSGFEQFIRDAVGHALPVYGRPLFDRVPSTFAPVDHVPVPAGYVIGPGDELLIRVWGKIELDSRVTVDRNGQIFLPKVGTLNLAGLRYDQLEGFLRSSIGALYKDFELNVTLGQLRSIQIFVLGRARQPGAYTVSALSTLVDALFASGGPSATGTMRRIELRRSGNMLAEFDIYDLLQKGDKSHDIRLLPGDVIYFPPAGPQVAVAGSVNEPGIYELRGQTNIGSLLEVAGGLTSLAGTKRVLLERIDDHNSRSVEEFELNASGLQRTLEDGDLLRVYPVSPEFKNAVTLRGNVAQPGRYAWHEGMRVSDLIPSRSFLVTRDYWNQQNHLASDNLDSRFGDRRSRLRTDQLGKSSGSAFRYIPEEGRTPLPLPPDDRPVSGRDSPQSDDRDSRQADSREPEQQVGSRQDRPVSDEPTYAPAMSQTDLMADIGRTDAEIDWDYAVVERLDDHDLSTRLITFNLGHAIDDPASEDNRTLRPGDVLTIFARRDLPLPVEKHATFVRISGEVNAPGVYRVNAGETLRNLVERAGGLTSHAYLYASQLTRVSTREAQEKQLKQSTDRMQQELLGRYTSTPPSTPERAAEQQAQLGLQQALLTRLSAVQPTGRVVLEIKPDAKSLAGVPDFPLEDGDSYYIPPRRSTVQVAGAVYNQNAFQFASGKTLSAYLNDAGGVTREADAKRIYLIRADGTVVSRQSRDKFWRGDFASMRLMPGDAIVVPEKIKTGAGWRNFQDMTQIVSQTALTAAALSVIQ